jgi:DNA-binding XRE family transcriptional regulator
MGLMADRGGGRKCPQPRNSYGAYLSARFPSGRCTETINSMLNWMGRLRELREASSLTRGQLSERVDLAIPTLKAYELGYRTPSRPTLIAVLRALDADPDTRAQVLEAAGYSREGVADIDERP